MKSMGSDGFANSLVVPMMVVSLIALAAIVFGAWAFNGRESYKNNEQSLVSSAVQTAVAKERASLLNEEAASNQSTTQNYTSPQQYGSVSVNYPKGWSGYVDYTNNADPVQAYFSPGVVPSVNATDSIFALRVNVVADSYSNELANYTANQQQEGLSITPYSLPKLPNVVGVMIKGQVQQGKNGVMVMFPLRTNTLEIWTESNQYADTFNQILQATTFQP